MERLLLQDGVEHDRARWVGVTRGEPRRTVWRESMRVLIIAFHYPPDPAVGGLRAESIANRLTASGHQVQVVSSSLPARSQRVEPGPVRVRRVPNILHVTRIWAWLKQRFRSDGPLAGVGADGGDPSWTPPAEISVARRFVLSLLAVPDGQQGWVPPAVAAGLLSIAGGIDVIYTTAPPYSVHVAGLLLKTLTGVPWVAELRDPWVGNWKPQRVRSRIGDRLDSWIERCCFRAADRVVTVTESAGRQLIARGVVDPDGLAVIRNGVPRARPPRAAPPRSNGRERVIVYAGSLYHRRDPRPFLEALAQLRREARLPALRVDFIGQCTHFEGQDVEAFTSRLGLQDLVRFIPTMPHDECQERIHQADMLLLLAQGQPTQVPQKLYEYFAADRPMIVFADPDGETSEMLRAVGGHFLISGTDPCEIAEELAAAFGQRSPTGADSRILAEWSVDRQLDALEHLLAEVAA